MEEEGESENHTMDMVDRISDLPENVQHHILSFLPNPIAACISILSKKWLHLWRTRSILCFELNSGANPSDGRNSIEFVDTTLDRHRQQGIRIQKFFIWLKLLPDEGKVVFPLLDNWLKIAVDQRVESVNVSCVEQQYVLTNHIFEAISMLHLYLSGQIKISLDNPSFVKCHNLKSLHLHDIVYVDNKTFHNIVSRCPLIEDFRLIYVRGLDRICLRSFSNLKILQIITPTRLSELFIDSPKLEEFKYESRIPSHWFPFDASQNLTYFSLRQVSITDSDFHKLLSQCPCIEVLRLFECDMLENINISSCSLRVFMLFWCQKLAKVIMDCPNLLSLQCILINLSILSNVCPVAHEKLELRIVEDRMDFSKFNDLKEFITKFKVSSLTFRIPADNMIINFADEWRAALVLPHANDIDELKFQFVQRAQASTFAALVNGLFWSCHPKLISLYWYEGSENFIKYLLKELTERGDSGCCSSSEIKCWRHHLLHVDIKCMIQEEWRSVLEIEDGTEKPEDIKEVRFILDWGNLGPEAHDAQDVNEQKLI